MILDKEGRIIAFGVGPPLNDATWAAAVEEFLKAMEIARSKLKFNKHGDRRGPFKTVAAGVSYGGGQKVWHHHLRKLGVPHNSLA